MLRIFRLFCVLFVVVSLFFSCKPINYFTRLKKTPGEYTFNYCDDNIKAPKSEYNKQIWIVFSDRENNPSYVNPGGKVKFKEFGFMDPFVVLKRKGEYLKLVKYDPEVVESLYNRKLKNRKKAEYCGWIHQSKLLLTRQTVTDVSSGYKDKQITVIKNSTPLADPKEFFVQDSIKAYFNEDLFGANGVVPFYSIVYTLKSSHDKTKSLIAKKTIISPDSSKSEVLGWVSSSLVRDIGQRLHVDIKTIPDSTLFFKDKQHKDTLPVSAWDLSENQIFNNKSFAARYNPVSYYDQKKTDTVSFRTGMIIPILDNKNNYVFNVNGNKIYYDQFKKIEDNSRKMNVIFVLEGHSRVLKSYSEITNIFQNLQPLFDNSNDSYKYQFGAILTSQGITSGSYPKIKTIGLTNDYPQLIDSLTLEIESTKIKHPISSQNAWSGLKKAVDILKPYKDQNNLLIVIGSSGYSEWADSTLVRQIGDLNCKILGFQMHGVEDVSGNNFVLQLENMIEISSDRIAKAKKEKTVYINQVKAKNRFVESSKNIYRLDYPNNSMSQGWLLFPEKEADLSLDVLANSIDSLVSEVKSDNQEIISSLYNAFNAVGKRRNVYGNLFADYEDIKDVKSLNKDFANNFSEETPMAYIPSERINLPDSINEKVKYQLLLSEEEVDDLILFLEKLTAIEVDIKYKGERIKKKQDHCNCSEDKDDFVKLDTISTSNDSIINIEYRSTTRLRSKLQQTYMKSLTYCKLCKRTSKTIKEYTLNEAQRQIIGAPSYTKMLAEYKIKDLTNKKKIPDAELDKLILYFKEKKENFKRKLSSLDKFKSNGEAYYWVDQALLP